MNAEQIIASIIIIVLILVAFHDPKPKSLREGKPQMKKFRKPL
jgi:hypothetical protein